MIKLISLNQTQSLMNNRFKLIFILFLTISGTVFSQYTEELNSNRPGSSQGAFSVGKKVLQFESGLNFGGEKHSLLNTKTGVFAFDYSIRYGVWKEELEVSLMGTFQSNTVERTLGTVTNETKLANFRSNTLGAKYLVFDPYRKMEKKGPNLYSWRKNHRFQWKDFIPAVSGYAGLNIDFLEDPDGLFVNSATRNAVTGIGLSPKLVVATQNNFVGGFVLVTNIVANRLTTDYKSFGYVITLTHTPTNWFSVFVENEGTKSDTYADQIFRGGVAVLITPDLQVDALGMINFKDTPSRTYGRLGVSYRFDMHDEDEYIENKGKEAREKKKSKKKTDRENRKKKKKEQKEQKKKEKEDNDLFDEDEDEDEEYDEDEDDGKL